MYESHEVHVEAGSCHSIHASTGLWCQLPPHEGGLHWANRGDQSLPHASKDRVYWSDAESTTP
jgi:hypothetical protein